MNLEQLNFELLKTCFLNNPDVVDVVKTCLRDGANVNTQGGETLSTPLMFAAYKNNINVVNVLIDYRANLNIQDINGNTALIIACEYGYTDIVYRLLSKIPDINIQNNKGVNALMMACKSRNLQIIKRLLEFPNIDINAKDIHGDTALMFSADFDDIDVVKLLIDTGKVDINAEDIDGLTALFFSIGKLPITKILVENGANVNGGSKGNHALLKSLYLRDISTTQYLIQNGANVNVEYTDSRIGHTRTPLMYAVSTNNISLIKLLLKSGADPEFESDDGLTAENLSHNPIIRKFFLNRDEHKERNYYGGKRKSTKINSKNKKTRRNKNRK